MEDASADKIEKINPRHSTQVDASVKTRHSTRAEDGMQEKAPQDGAQASKASIFEDPEEIKQVYKTKAQKDQEKRYGELVQYQLNYQSSSARIRQGRENQAHYFVNDGSAKPREASLRIPSSRMFNDLGGAGKDKAESESAGDEGRTSEIRVGSKPDTSLDFETAEEGDQANNAKEEQKYQEKQYRQQLRSKGSRSLAVKSNSLDYLGGDVTLTDRYGMIRGTFMQRNE